jgi:Protein of unknown function (DUF3035)
MNQRFTLLLCAVSLVAMSGCSAFRSATGSSKRTPDEFAVAREAPLVVPPDFTLRPPRPGAPRPQEVDAQGQAVQALFGSGASVPAKSPAEQALLDKAGAARVTTDIRSTVKDDGTIVADKGALLKDILSTADGSTAPGVVVSQPPK